ncbi:helix-turn-helix domain-containing protein [Flavobacterium sp. MC2016-06]|jgi:AraC-like DNA-binding protein|uniref:helix-turn-helix domain-containing protein n=1 Tax=Flavobacterium sp. MC2016-06 TaxID=2676308 RepID=UPI0012BAB160|nr:helix-turn-helix domain-containing protein [Flavobacterium sp. MC2016-06]MBU3860477.1 helix-turn-helix domain-containing protein [Flavobacterium sp. MC2016-06]
MLSLSNLAVEKEIKNSFSIHFFEDKEHTELSTYRLTYNRIVLIDSGIGEVIIDGETFTISSSTLFLIAKGQLISFKPNSKFTGYELSFGDCFWERTPSSANNCKAVLFNNASANQTIPLEKEDCRELNSIFKFLSFEFNKQEYINQLDAMAAYLKIIMIKIANVNHSLSKGFDSYENQVYAQFLQLISKNYKTSREVVDYANILGISARKLTDLSKRCSDRGAKELINGQIIAEAKRSLQFTSNPIKEIAFQLNFASPDQFSHFFKKNTQVSPNDYRALFLNIGV